MKTYVRHKGCQTGNFRKSVDFLDVAFEGRLKRRKMLVQMRLGSVYERRHEKNVGEKILETAM